MRRIFELLKQDRQHIKKLNDRTRKNVISNQATVASQYGKSFNICSIELEPNTKYLILANVAANLGADSVITCSLSLTGTHTYSLIGNSRGTMRNGGGTSAWAYVETDETETHTVTINTYGYYNATYNQAGKIVAIPVEVLGGGTT